MLFKNKCYPYTKRVFVVYYYIEKLETDETLGHDSLFNETRTDRLE